MRRSLPSLLLTVLFTFAAMPVWAEPADGPHYVVQVQPAGKLLKTVRELYRKFATPQLGEKAGEKTRAELDGQLDVVLGKGWHEAVDEERPILLFEGRLQIMHLSLVGGKALQVRASVNLLLMPRAAARPVPEKPPRH